ncbi:MAG: hypothetical protein RR550_01095 [Rikenellaceae bacterium]
MKKNFVVLFLVVVTLSVWFTVFYRLFNRGEEVVTVTKKSPHQGIFSEDILQLNYRDPFRYKKVVVAPKKVVIKDVVTLPSFTYKGMIKSKKGVFLIINDTLVRPRDKIGTYTITKIYRDSIKVKKGTHTHTIRRN